MGGATNGLISKVGNLANMFKSFGKGGAIGMVLAAAGGLISAMSAGIKSSEETTKKWRKELAQVKPIIDDLDVGLERMGRGAAKIASFFLAILGAMTNFANFIASGFKYNKVMDAANDAVKEAVQLEEREIANETELNNLSVLEVSAQTRLNELKAIAADTDHKSYAERKAALEEIDAIEQTFENRRVAAAKEAYDIQVANRKGEQASVEEAKKERELYIAWLQAKADAQAADIAREKEIYQIQKDASEEALDYKIRIMESERNMLETRLSMVEAGSAEELELRASVADKEYKIAVAQAQKEVKNIQYRNQLIKEAELKLDADIKHIQEDFYAAQLEKIRNQTDAAVANTVNEWMKSLPKLQGLLNEYNAKLSLGKPSGQSTAEWEKELAQMRETLRKTWIDGMTDAFDQIEKVVKDKVNNSFTIWEQGTSSYLYDEIQQYKNMYDILLGEREYILDKLQQMEGESDEEYNKRREQAAKEFDLRIYESRKKIVEDYQKWYYARVKETDQEIFLSSQHKYEDYVNNIPHSIWEYMFKPNENEMENLQKELDNAKTRFEDAKQTIVRMMGDLWDESMGEFNFSDAFDLLPDDIQKDYLTKLENYVNAEKAILEKRKEG